MKHETIKYIDKRKQSKMLWLQLTKLKIRENVRKKLDPDVLKFQTGGKPLALNFFLHTHKFFKHIVDQMCDIHYYVEM